MLTTNTTTPPRMHFYRRDAKWTMTSYIASGQQIDPDQAAVWADFPDVVASIARLNNLNAELRRHEQALVECNTALRTVDSEYATAVRQAMAEGRAADTVPNMRADLEDRIAEHSRLHAAAKAAATHEGNDYNRLTASHAAELVERWDAEAEKAAAAVGPALDKLVTAVDAFNRAFAVRQRLGYLDLFGYSHNAQAISEANRLPGLPNLQGLRELPDRLEKLRADEAHVRAFRAHQKP